MPFYEGDVLSRKTDGCFTTRGETVVVVQVEDDYLVVLRAYVKRNRKNVLSVAQEKFRLYPCHYPSFARVGRLPCN